MVENELQFVNWAEFQEMVPSILQLERSRLAALITEAEDQPELRRALKEAHEELETFMACLPSADKTKLERTCAPHLEAALLTLSMQAEQQEDETAETLHYIADRLKHIHDRMELVY